MRSRYNGLKILRKVFQVTFAVIFILSTAFFGNATTVDVYAEGACTETTFTINIYADIYADINQEGEEGLFSAGVKLTYPSSKLLNPAASKNEEIWYFGTPENKYPYIDPEVESSGEIIFILGKLDQNNPQEGVKGNRIHLGRATFDRSLNSSLPVITEFTLVQGRPGEFTDFASIDDSKTVNFLITPIVYDAMLYLQNVIRILRVLTGDTTVVAVHATEMDINNDGVVGLQEAIDLMKEAAQ